LVGVIDVEVVIQVPDIEWRKTCGYGGIAAVRQRSSRQLRRERPWPRKQGELEP